MKLNFVTSNFHKAQELTQILGFSVELANLDIAEIQSLDIQEVAQAKAEAAFTQLKKPVLVEDTSLEIAVLGNLPGTLIKFFLEQLGSEGICALLKFHDNRQALATACFCLYDGQEFKFFVGKIAGQISMKPLGESGFGWDNIFVPEGQDKTFAQLTAQEKNAISHRRQALEKLKRFLLAQE